MDALKQRGLELKLRRLTCMAVGYHFPLHLVYLIVLSWSLDREGKLKDRRQGTKKYVTPRMPSPKPYETGTLKPQTPNRYKKP